MWAPSIWSLTHLRGARHSRGSSSPTVSLLNWETRTAPHRDRPEPRNSLPETNSASCLPLPKLTPDKPARDRKCPHDSRPRGSWTQAGWGCRPHTAVPGIKGSQKSPRTSRAPGPPRSAWYSAGVAKGDTRCYGSLKKLSSGGAWWLSR